MKNVFIFQQEDETLFDDWSPDSVAGGLSVWIGDNKHFKHFVFLIVRLVGSIVKEPLHLRVGDQIEWRDFSITLDRETQGDIWLSQRERRKIDAVLMFSYIPFILLDWLSRQQFCLNYAAASRGCFCVGSQCGDWRTCRRSNDGFHGWTSAEDTRNAAIPILKQELMNSGLQFTLGTSVVCCWLGLGNAWRQWLGWRSWQHQDWRGGGREEVAGGQTLQSWLQSGDEDLQSLGFGL